jgi:rfaE bifunctional protein kinase chain/domain
VAPPRFLIQPMSSSSRPPVAPAHLRHIHVPIDRFSRARVLVVGDVMLDRYWFGDASRISPEAPVPVVLVQRQEDRLGGAANVARNAATLGAQASLLCVIGRDEPGERIMALLRESRVAAHVARDPKLPTTIKLRVLARQHA